MYILVGRCFFSSGKDVCSIFYCKIICDVPKITKKTLSLCFKARPPVSMIKRHHSCHFQAQWMQKWCGSSLQSPSLHLHHQNKKGEATNRQTKKQTHCYAKISKFKNFKNFNSYTHTYINQSAVLCTTMMCACA